MILPGEIKILQDFALANRDNLSTTLKVCSSFEHIRDLLIKEFLTILQRFIINKLGDTDWAVDDKFSDHL